MHLLLYEDKMTEKREKTAALSSGFTKTQMRTVTCSKVEISHQEIKKKSTGDIIPHQFLYINLLKMENVGTRGDVSEVLQRPC